VLFAYLGEKHFLFIKNLKIGGIAYEHKRNKKRIQGKDVCGYRTA
jgi:hypothetical protein